MIIILSSAPNYYHVGILTGIECKLYGRHVGATVAPAPAPEQRP